MSLKVSYYRSVLLETHRGNGHGVISNAKPYLLTTWNFIYSPTDDSDIVLTIDNVLDRRDNTKHTSTNYYTAPRTFLLSYNYKF